MSAVFSSDQEQKDLVAALEESFTLGAQILTSCIEENREYFQSRPELFAKVSERLERGNELVQAGNYRAAGIIQRHAIDLILQKDHSVFKDSASLRKALLRYRDHGENVIAPLWEKQKNRSSEGQTN